MASRTADREQTDGALVTATIDHWQRAAGVSLSEKDAWEAIRNVSSFFDLLARWDEAQGDPRVAEVAEVGHK